jgi:hypothetical protein
LENSWLSATGKIIKTIGKTDNLTKKMIRKTFLQLIKIAGRNIDTLLKQNYDEK